MIHLHSMEFNLMEPQSDQMLQVMELRWKSQMMKIGQQLKLIWINQELITAI